MKVYVLLNIDDAIVLGVYDDKGKADKALEKIKKKCSPIKTPFHLIERQLNDANFDWYKMDY